MAGSNVDIRQIGAKAMYDSAFGYTAGELQHMSIDALQALSHAAHALNNAMADYGDKANDWRPGTVELRRIFTAWDYAILGYVASKESAIRRAWHAVVVAANESAIDQQIAIGQAFQVVAEIARLQQTDLLRDHDFDLMRAWIEDRIWRSSTDARMQQSALRTALWRKRTNASRMTVIRHWAGLDICK